MEQVASTTNEDYKHERREIAGMIYNCLAVDGVMDSMLYDRIAAKVKNSKMYTDENEASIARSSTIKFYVDKYVGIGKRARGPRQVGTCRSKKE